MLALTVAYFVTSLIYCYDATLPKPRLNPDGTVAGSDSGSGGSKGAASPATKVEAASGKAAAAKAAAGGGEANGEHPKAS